MLELFATIAAAGVGYVRSRSFVARRLRYVDAVQSPAAPLIAGAAAAVVAAPVVWILPVIGTGTALLFGAAVGVGTRAGIRQIRRGLLPG
ncbi:MAG TPA: hypothetical protein VK936_10545 [Longimicrobiales bacterium]|nr:hypothetical protein [Longimicrobiales bacterium]